MVIRFNCPQCDSHIEYDEIMSGSTVACPRCQHSLVLPRQGLHSGMTVGSYRLDRKLGVGGMGEVWLARHTAMQREVALKILSPVVTANPEFVKDFRREVQIAAKLEHPNIVTAFDAGQDQDIHFMAVSYVDGEELGQRLRRQKALPEREALQIAHGVAEALSYAWNKFQMLHRDVKPDNIMLTTDGVPKLMDMGISKTLSKEETSAAEEYIVGTPEYMSPEQARADDGIDFRTDIYSLGATLYHLITGTLPFSGDATVIMTKQISEPLESPRKRNPQMSEGCAALIDAMMAKEAKDRPASWEEVVKDID